MTRITYDTEFIEDGKTIELVSIGMIREDTGEKIYAVNREFNEARLLESEWLRNNVWPSLPTRNCEAGKRCHPERDWPQHLDRDDPDVRPRRQIARMVERFIQATPEPELWGYYSSYDHVVYAQLFGRMIDLPEGCPMFTRDIKQEIERLGGPDMPRQVVGQHNALADAEHNLVMLRFLDQLASVRQEEAADDPFRV